MQVFALVLALALLFMCNLKKQVQKTNCWTKQEGVLVLVPVPVPAQVGARVPVLVPMPVRRLSQNR